ncbi:hypothetical protein BC830DRAFT_1155369 [Chytriomyces sp. MP71]|nr:hypothetical protein BC830DRAFT_1155369 [Chytriomyces sp. MP71]
MLVKAVLAVTALAASVAADLALPSNVALQLMHGGKKHSGIQNAAPPGSHLTYYGGPVITNVEVHPIFYGAANYQSQLNAFYKGVVQSSWYDIMTQYNVYRGSAVDGFSVSQTKSSLDDVNDIQALLIGLVRSGQIKPNANTYYPIHFAPGISITQGGSNSCQVFCAYHGTIDISSLNVGTQYLYYGVMPDQGGSCAGGCGSNPSQVNNLFSVSSHELAEAATDAAVGLATTNGPPLAWYDATNGEIGDICNAQQGTTVGGDGVSYVIQTQWSNAANACVANSSNPPPTTSKVPPPPSSTTAKSKTTSTLSIMPPKTSSSKVVTTAPVTTGGGSGVPSGPCSSFGATQCYNHQSYMCYYWTGLSLTWQSQGAGYTC